MYEGIRLERIGGLCYSTLQGGASFWLDHLRRRFYCCYGGNRRRFVREEQGPGQEAAGWITVKDVRRFIYY